MIRAARVVLGILACALLTVPIVIATGIVVDWAMESPALLKPMIDTFESPGWARVSAFIWSVAALAGVLVGAIPALLIGRSKGWPESKRLVAVVIGASFAGAVLVLPMQSIVLSMGAAATAILLSWVFWLVAGR